MSAIDILFAVVGLAAGFAFGWMALNSKLAHTRGRSIRLQDERDELKAALEATRSELTEYRERKVILETEKKNLEQQMLQLETKFKNTASSVLEEITTKFSTQSEKKLGDLLNPMRERLVEFQKMIGDSFSQQGKEQHTLKAEIEKIVLQTDSLTKALRGDVKAQGNWGEVMLEKILEESGLRPGIDYVAQGLEMGLSGADGNRLKPDYIINLPDKKHIIVDSKVSITAYDRYCGEQDELAREAHLKEFLRSIKAHVTGLEQKRYQDIEKLDAPEFVLMFMPLEGAYSLALQKDRELHGYAWSKKIAIVCPTTLFVTLKTIASLWQRERLHQNVEEIARQGGALYDKFVGFVDDMDSIGKQITKVQQTYDGAMGKLKTGTGNLIGRVEKLKQLGAKTTKSLPKTVSDEESDNVVLLSEAAGSESP